MLQDILSLMLWTHAQRDFPQLQGDSTAHEEAPPPMYSLSLGLSSLDPDTQQYNRVTIIDSPHGVGKFIPWYSYTPPVHVFGDTDGRSI
jgi:hypothetical protein